MTVTLIVATIISLFFFRKTLKFESEKGEEMTVYSSSKFDSGCK